MEADIPKWAWNVLDKMPAVPVSSIVAVLIIALLAIPPLLKVWKAWKELKVEDHHPAAPSDPIIQQTPWLITTLNGIDIRIQSVERDTDAMQIDLRALVTAVTDVRNELKTVVSRLDSTIKLLRGRQNRSR